MVILPLCREASSHSKNLDVPEESDHFVIGMKIDVTSLLMSF